MIEGYTDRMIRAPRFVREGNRLIPEDCFVTVRVKRDADAADRDEGVDE